MTADRPSTLLSALRLSKGRRPTAEGLSASLAEHPRAAGIRGALRLREKPGKESITKTRKGENTKEEGGFIKEQALFRLPR